MKITNLKINHISNPLGYWYRTLSASWKVEEAKGQKQKYTRILVALDESFETLVWDSGKKTDLDSRGTSVDVSLKPRTRYYWKVQVWDDAGDAGESCIQWFETGLMETGFQGIPITPDLDPSIQPVYEKTFTHAKKPEKARLYLTCLGVYELEINGKRVGEEFLAPGFTVYEDYVQYQTYDVGAYLTAGENVIRVLAGDGWYKGLYGYRQNEKYREGKVFELLADLYTDDECILCTDLSWKVRKSQIVFSDHYDGEIYDACLDDSEVFPVKEGKLGGSGKSHRDCDTKGSASYVSRRNGSGYGTEYGRLCKLFLQGAQRNSCSAGARRSSPGWKFFPEKLPDSKSQI